MDESLKIVNGIVSGLQRYIATNPEAVDIAKRESEIDALKELIGYCEEQLARNTPVDPELGDLSDLPKELLAELNLSAPSELEQRIVAIIKNCPDEKSNINTILVELFRRHGVKQKRRNMQNKLWRMMDNKLIYGVDGEKGVYTTIKPEPFLPGASQSEDSFEDYDLDGDVPF